MLEAKGASRFNSELHLLQAHLHLGPSHSFSFFSTASGRGRPCWACFSGLGGHLHPSFFLGLTSGRRGGGTTWEEATSLSPRTQAGPTLVSGLGLGVESLPEALSPRRVTDARFFCGGWRGERCRARPPWLLLLGNSRPRPGTAVALVQGWDTSGDMGTQPKGCLRTSRLF